MVLVVFFFSCFSFTCSFVLVVLVILIFVCSALRQCKRTAICFAYLSVLSLSLSYYIVDPLSTYTDTIQSYSPITVTHES